MSKTVNKLYKHNTTIYKVILFLITTIAIVYLFPKGGQFKYEFTKGKPWQYDNLYAPFDFAINKSEEEITEEIKTIEVAAKLYFQFNKETVAEVKKAYQLRTSLYNVSDSLSKNDIESMLKTGNTIIENVYKNGFIEATSEGIISDKNSFIALKKDNQVQDIIYTNLLYSKDVFELIKNSLGEQPYSYSQNINLSILSEVI
ncbi:MAG: phosphohydrolase, partial [Flavobacteriaceae bacterium]|nr:phosphohydrolase [Flavobacteriaceae bacterium]